VTVLATDPAKYKLIVDALRKRLDNSEAGPDSNHLLQVNPLKHDPFIVFSADSATIKVRGPEASTINLHPQTPEHHISYLWVENEKGEVVHLAELPGAELSPESSFKLAGIVGSLTPYSLCNLHGLWQGPTYNVDFEKTAAPYANLDGYKGPFSWHAYKGKLEKHTPFIAELGADNVAHLGVAGSDTEPTTVLHVQQVDHYIATIYVKDQHGVVAGLKKLGPKDGSKIHEFAVNPTAAELTPYEYCNVHGLWAGPKFVKSQTAKDL